MTTSRGQGRIPEYRLHCRFRQKVDVQKRLSLISPILPSSTPKPPCSRHNQHNSTTCSQDSIGGTLQNFQSHGSDRKLDCCNRLAVLSASLPSATSQTPWRNRKHENSTMNRTPQGVPHKISNPMDRTENWTVGTGSPSSLHPYHRRPPKPLGGAANAKIRPRAPPRWGAIL